VPRGPAVVGLRDPGFVWPRNRVYRKAPGPGSSGLGDPSRHRAHGCANRHACRTHAGSNPARLGRPTRPGCSCTAVQHPVPADVEHRHANWLAPSDPIRSHYDPAAVTCGTDPCSFARTRGPPRTQKSPERGWPARACRRNMSSASTGIQCARLQRPSSTHLRGWTVTTRKPGGSSQLLRVRRPPTGRSGDPSGRAADESPKAWTATHAQLQPEVSQPAQS
jgi:hypothetical protein